MVFLWFLTIQRAEQALHMFDDPLGVGSGDPRRNRRLALRDWGGPLESQGGERWGKIWGGNHGDLLYQLGPIGKMMVNIWLIYG